MDDESLDLQAAAALGDVLRAVGRELADLGRLASELQAAVGPPALAGGPDGAALYRLQTLDVLTQALHGASDFLCALAPTVPAHWLCDPTRAARALSLSDLARRLSCPGHGAAPPPNNGAGELELFEG